MGEQHLGKSSWYFCFLFYKHRRMLATTAIMLCEFLEWRSRIIFVKSPFIVVLKREK